MATEVEDDGIGVDDACAIDFEDLEVESEIDSGCFGAVYRFPLSSLSKLLFFFFF